MDRLSRDSDDQHVKIRNTEYETYDQLHTDNRLSNRQNYDRTNQNGYYTVTKRQPDNDQSKSHVKFRDSHHQDERERADVPHKTQSRVIVDNNHEVNQRRNPSNQIQNPPKVDYTVNQKKSGNSRSFEIDINISVNIGGRNPPQVTTNTYNIPSRSAPIRSTATIEDVGYVDLDIRAPERTARLATDGLIRPSSSSSKHSKTENKK